MSLDNTARASEVASENMSEPVEGYVTPIHYMVAGLSFVPLFGVLMGPLAMLWGLINLKRGGKPIAVIGTIGLCGQSLFFSFVLNANGLLG